MGDQLAAFLAVIAVQNRGGDVVDVEGGGVSEHDHLNDRRHDQRKAGARIAQDLDELLDHQLPDTRKHRLQSSVFWKARIVNTPTTRAKTAISSIGPLIALIPAPFRKTLLRIVT